MFFTIKKRGSAVLQKILERANNFIEENRISGIIIAIVAFIIIVLFSFSDVYKVFELRFYDIRFRLKPSIEEWERLTFIDIDENSLTTIGQFPWPRYLYGNGLMTMRQLGISQATMDMIFPDESPRQVDERMLGEVLDKAEGGGRVTPVDISTLVVDNDRAFAEGVQVMGNVILAYTFSDDPPVIDVINRQQTPEFQQARERFLDRSSFKIPEEDLERYRSLEDRRFESLSYPIPPLMETGKLFGFVNRYTDIDGITRKVQLVQMYDGRLYFNLAFVMLMDACHATFNDVEVEPGKRIVIKNAFNPMTFTTGDLVVPIDKQGMMYVNWAGSGPREETFNIVPFFALIDYEYFAYGTGGVHDYFDQMGAANGDNIRIAKLQAGIERLESEYIMTDDPAMKKEKYRAMQAMRSEKRSIREGYNRLTLEEIEDIKKELEENDDPRLRQELSNLRNQYQAVDLVLRLEALRDHIVITGLTATATHDIGAIPIHHEYPNVGAYHNTVNTIINGEYIRKAGNVVNYMIILVVALLMGFSIQRLNVRMSLIVIFASFFGVNLVIIILFALGNIWVDQLGISLAVLFPSAAIATIKFINEENQKRFIKNAFSRYIAPDVIEEIIENPETLELGGEERNITSFFSDVEGFSSISEMLSPRELVNVLNQYLSEMTDIILKYGGTIDKYEGDAIIAFYGAPHPFPDHAVKACLASIEMKRRLKELQEEWRSAGQVELKARMGMNTGFAVVGNMGSSTRMDYTAMGDTINLASRLEGVNKIYKTYAMISGDTYNAAKDVIEARKLDQVRVMGKDEIIPIYELLGRKGTLPDRMYEMLEVYYEGLDQFKNREWKKARTTFRKALKIVEDDGPSLMYVDRCQEFMKNPPSRKWDGVYSMKTK